MAAQKDNDVPRRPGRPRGKKPGTASREQLMDIALMLFARQGSPYFAQCDCERSRRDAGDAALLFQLAGSVSGPVAGRALHAFAQ